MGGGLDEGGVVEGLFLFAAEMSAAILISIGDVLEGGIWVIWVGFFLGKGACSSVPGALLKLALCISKSPLFAKKYLKSINQGSILKQIYL
jgi:hypothetical protein